MKVKTAAILTMSVGGFLLLAACAFFFGLLPSQETPVIPTQTSSIPYPDVPRVDPEAAVTAMNAGSAVFIDVRGEPFYSQGHIPGALSITQDEVPMKIGSLDRSKWIILYCT